MSPIAQRAAAAFVSAAREVDPSLSQAGIGRIIGEPPQKMTDCIRGREGSLDRVHRWIVQWGEAGRPPLELVVTADTAIVRRVTIPV